MQKYVHPKMSCSIRYSHDLTVFANACVFIIISRFVGRCIRLGVCGK